MKATILALISTNEFLNQYPMKATRILRILALTTFFFACKTEKKEAAVAFEKFQFATPEAVGMSSDSLAQIQDLVNEYVTAKNTLARLPSLPKTERLFMNLRWAGPIRCRPFPIGRTICFAWLR